jgi:hypothetical protein
MSRGDIYLHGSQIYQICDASIWSSWCSISVALQSGHQWSVESVVVSFLPLGYLQQLSKWEKWLIWWPNHRSKMMSFAESPCVSLLWFFFRVWINNIIYDLGELSPSVLMFSRCLVNTKKGDSCILWSFICHWRNGARVAFSRWCYHNIAIWYQMIYGSLMYLHNALVLWLIIDCLNEFFIDTISNSWNRERPISLVL